MASKNINRSHRKQQSLFPSDRTGTPTARERHTDPGQMLDAVGHNVTHTFTQYSLRRSTISWYRITETFGRSLSVRMALHSIMSVRLTRAERRHFLGFEWRSFMSSSSTSPPEPGR